MNMAELRALNDDELIERRVALMQEARMIEVVERERTYSTGAGKIWQHKKGVW